MQDGPAASQDAPPNPPRQAPDAASDAPVPRPRHRERLPSIVLAAIGVLLTAGSAYALFQVFAEEPIAKRFLYVLVPETCRNPKDIEIGLHVSDAGVLSASVWPIFQGSDGHGPRCLKVMSEESIHLDPNPVDIWVDAQKSGPPLIETVARLDAQAPWRTTAYFPVPPPPDGEGQIILRKRPLTVVFDAPMSRPTFTRLAMRMTVIAVERPQQKSLSVRWSENLEMKSFDSNSSESTSKGSRTLQVSFVRNMSIFELSLSGGRREKYKEIIVLVAGGLLLLGIGCLVDLAIKILELRPKARAL